jgi:hypothetical protein
MGSTGAPPAAWQGPGIEEVQTAANPLISGRCVFKRAEPALFDPVRAGLIARLGGPDYSLLDSTFEMLRPIVGDEDSGARLESD